jgi:hypothetical protein
MSKCFSLSSSERKRERNDCAYLRDERDKPEKWTRIEGTLEPLNRAGLLVLNVDEKDNPHFKRLESQFKTASATCRIMDGPDCIEGAVFIIKNKLAVREAEGMKVIRRPPNKKRF